MANYGHNGNFDDGMGDDDDIPADFLQEVDMLCTQAYQEGTTAKRPRRDEERTSDPLEEMRRKMLEQEGALKLVRDENERLKAENRTAERNYMKLMNEKNKQYVDLKKEIKDKERTHETEVEQLRTELKFKAHAQVAKAEQARRSLNASQMMAPSPSRHPMPPPARRPVLSDAGIQTEPVAKKSSIGSIKVQAPCSSLAPFSSAWPWEASRLSHFTCLSLHSPSSVDSFHEALEADLTRGVEYLLDLSARKKRFKQVDTLLKLRDVASAFSVLARKRPSGLSKNLTEACVELGKVCVRMLKDESTTEHLHLAVKICEASVKMHFSSNQVTTKRLINDVLELAVSLVSSKDLLWRTRILGMSLLEALVASGSCHGVQCTIYQDRRLAPFIGRRFLEDVAFDKQQWLAWSERVLRLTCAGLPGHDVFNQFETSGNCPSSASAARSAVDFLTANLLEVVSIDEDRWEEEGGGDGLRPGSADLMRRCIRMLESATVGRNLIACDFHVARLVANVQRLAVGVELGRGDEAALSSIVSYVPLDDEPTSGDS